MTWSYTVTDLATSAKDQVRLLIGDTVSGAPQLQDEEINFFLGQRSSVYGAAAMACRSLATQYSRSADAAAGDTKRAFSQMAKAYGAAALQFEEQSLTRGGLLPYAGGISITDKQSQEQDTDRVPPQFNIGMDDDYVPVAPVGNEVSGGEALAIDE